MLVGVGARSERHRGAEPSADTLSRRRPASLAALCFHPCFRQSTDKLELICVISASASLGAPACYTPLCGVTSCMDHCVSGSSISHRLSWLVVKWDAFLPRSLVF